MLLTIGLPVFAAIAFEYAFNHLYLAWEWRGLLQAFLSSSRRLDQTRKRIEAIKERVNHQVVDLDEQRKERINAYLQSYEVGRKVGAQQEPFGPILTNRSGGGVRLVGLPFIRSGAGQLYNLR